MEKKLTIYDIAKEAGVSTATVTRVMSGHASVRPSTREKVQAVIDLHGYTPSAIAQDLENGKNKTIGIILPEIINPYFAQLFNAADDEARQSGYSVWLNQLPSYERVEDSLVDDLIRRRLDGAFFMGGIWETQRPGLMEAINRLGQYMPIVALCPPQANLNCICLYNDLTSCVRHAVRHLHVLGHRRIAFIGGSLQVGGSGARGQGFLDELRALGLPDDPAYHHEGGFDAESGERAVQRLLSGLEKSRWPTALVAFNDLVALGAIKQLKQIGLKLPEDMAIIGCDNQFFCTYTDPPLTSMDLHPEEHARSAIRELLSAKDHNTPPFNLMRDATLVVRESCGAKLGYRKMG
ncbi:MAG: LacI family DNA-binding transcriptional regulator [Eubacteriales bacterium]|nr:LacI family DNA-binding transcriptional regulator [Eubacteriales bacterium]